MGDPSVLDPALLSADSDPRRDPDVGDLFDLIIAGLGGESDA